MFYVRSTLLKTKAKALEYFKRQATNYTLNKTNAPQKMSKRYCTNEFSAIKERINVLKEDELKTSFVKKLASCLKNGDYQQAEAILSTLSGDSLDTESFNNLIALAHATGNKDRVMDLFVQMHDAKIKPNTMTYQILIGTFVKTKDPHKALQIFEELDNEQRIMLDVDSLLMIMLSYLKLYDVANIVSVYNTIIKLDSIPTAKQKNFADSILLKAFARTSQYHLVAKHFESIRLESTFEPTIDIYDVMIKSYTEIKSYDKVYELYKEIQSMSGFANISEWKNLIFSFFHLNKLSEAKDLYNNISKSQSVPTFDRLYQQWKTRPLINVELPHEDVLELISQNKPIPETEYHTKAAFMIYTSPRFFSWRKAVSYFDEYHKKYKASQELFDRIIESMISIDHADLAKHYIDTKNESHLPNSNAIMMKIIAFCVDRNDIEYVEAVLKDYDVKNLSEVDVWVYTINCLLKKHSEHKLTHQIWEKLLTSNYKIPLKTINSMLAVFSAQGDDKSVFKALNFMKAQGIDPNLEIYTSLIELYGKKHNYEMIISTVYFVTKIKKMSLNINFVYKLIIAVGRCNRIEQQLNSLFSFVKIVGLSPTLLNALFEACEYSKKTHLIPVVLNQWMDIANITLQPSNFTEWMGSCLMTKNYHSAFYLIDFMTEKNIVPQRRLAHTFVLIVSPHAPLIKSDVLIKSWMYPEEEMSHGELLTNEEFKEFKNTVAILKGILSANQHLIQ